MPISKKDTRHQTSSLRALRRARGWSQEELARRAGCSSASITLFEAGYRPERSEVLARVMAVLEDGDVVEKDEAPA
jgi:transcriptional regulator with XRE-family HTH domain